MFKDSIHIKRFISLILLVTASIFALSACVTTETAVNPDDIILRNVIENEKDLISLQLRELKVDEYKEKVKQMLHPYYSSSYIDRIDKIENGGYIFALATKSPVDFQISKVYTGENKTVFIKAPVDDGLSQNFKMYIFKKEKDEWKLYQSREIYVVMAGEMKDSFERIKEIFTNYDNMPIEYSTIRMKD